MGKADEKPVTKRARVDEVEQDDVGPMPAPSKKPDQVGNEDDDSDDDDDDAGASDLEDESTFPITHEISLKDHTKVGFDRLYEKCGH